jgi:hypothetical protein
VRDLLLVSLRWAEPDVLHAMIATVDAGRFEMTTAVFEALFTFASPTTQTEIAVIFSYFLDCPWVTGPPVLAPLTQTRSDEW